MKLMKTYQRERGRIRMRPASIEGLVKPMKTYKRVRGRVGMWGVGLGIWMQVVGNLGVWFGIQNGRFWV